MAYNQRSASPRGRSTPACLDAPFGPWPWRRTGAVDTEMLIEIDAWGFIDDPE
jgi:hypothetical protein